ncbi:MAG: response regulator transcription factor [Caulobacterales bacterium]|uniref:response regulator transcription factor n=1 Tax=Glycocaulis sp. TaxID=1969725 RepID=UPI003FA0167A
MNILIIEDDARVADFLERGLRAEGYRLRVARNGPEGLEKARSLWEEMRELDQRAVVLLDLMLPGMNGLDLCQTLRASRVEVPILMLTALGRTEDRVTGLRMGADDYLVKPFAFEELLARIEALLRRGRAVEPAASPHLAVGDLVLDRAQFTVSRDGSDIRLTAKEIALLELLMSAPGRVFSRERILTNVWGIDEDPLTNVVDVYIRRLRAKVDEPFGTPLIETVRGLGYRIAPPPAGTSRQG